MTKSRKFALRTGALFAFMAIAATILVWLLSESGTPLLGSSSYELEAVLPSAAQLANHADVRVGGVKVGQVTGLRLVGSGAVVGMSLDPSLGGVYDNATVQLRYKTVLAEGYVDLQPGGPPGQLLPNDSTLPLSRAAETVQIDQVLSTFDPRTRQQLAKMLDGFGVGLRGQGSNLNDLLGSAARLVDDGSPVIALLGRQRDQVATLMEDLPKVARAVGERGGDLQALARRALALSKAVAQRDQLLSGTIAQLPGTITEAGAAADDLGRLSAQTTPVLAELTRALVDLRPAILNLKPAASGARTVVARLAEFEPRAMPLVAALTPFAARVTALVPRFDGVLRQSNPLVSYMAPYNKDLAGFFSNGAAVTQSTDGTSHLARLSFVFSRETISRLLTPAELRILDALEKAGILTALGGHIQQNAYPAPGTVNSLAPFTGSYPRLQQQPPLFRQEP